MADRSNPEGNGKRAVERRVGAFGKSPEHTPRRPTRSAPGIESDLGRPAAPPMEERDYALLRAALDHINQGLSVVDRQLRVVLTNKKLFELFDFPPELAEPDTSFDAFMRYNAERGEYGPGDTDKLTRERVELAQKFKSHYMERTRPNGRIIAVQGEPLPQGGFVSVYTDVTEQRKSEFELRERSTVLEERVKERTVKLSAANIELRKTLESQKKMESALVQAKKMEAVGRIAGGLSHDFNNLLTVILGNLTTLKEKYEGWEDIADHLEPAIRAARRGAQTTRQLLAFARRQPLQPIPVDVRMLITDLVPLLRRSMGAIEIAVVSNIENGECHAFADPHMLENALLNLAMNSRDAMPNGGLLSVEIELVRHDGKAIFDAPVEEGDYVQVAVRDTGVGIPREILPKVFEPFVTTKDAGSGTGLGLSLVYGFVKQSGGFIRIESERQKGTCVTLLLPRTTTGHKVNESECTSSHSFGDGGGKLVLLVEDEEDVRTIIRRQLSDHGYLVVEARDGQQATHFIDNIRNIDILISDVMMSGGMSGLELVRRVRATRPEIKSILISGIAEWVDRVQGEESDFPILRKPFDKSELLSLIRSTG